MVGKQASVSFYIHVSIDYNLQILCFPLKNPFRLVRSRTKMLKVSSLCPFNFLKILFFYIYSLENLVYFVLFQD